MITKTKIKQFLHRRELIKIYQKKLNEIHINARKIHVYMWLNTASSKSHVGNKTRLFRSPFHVSTSSGLTLAGAFRSNRVDACSTALRSASEENESCGYVAVPCPPKVKQRSGTADWLKL